MLTLLKSNVGRLRIIAFLEGCSLLLLIFIAMPVKYLFKMPEPTHTIGMIHGILFLLFTISALALSIIQKWTLNRIFRVLLSSVLPFGTFYVDKKILSKLPTR